MTAKQIVTLAIQDLYFNYLPIIDQHDTKKAGFVRDLLNDFAFHLDHCKALKTNFFENEVAVLNALFKESAVRLQEPGYCWLQDELFSLLSKRCHEQPIYLDKFGIFRPKNIFEPAAKQVVISDLNPSP
jgi:hypothetical protein